MAMTAGITSAGQVDGTVAETMATPAKGYGALHTRKPAKAEPFEWPAAKIRVGSMQSRP